MAPHRSREKADPCGARHDPVRSLGPRLDARAVPRRLSKGLSDVAIAVRLSAARIRADAEATGAYSVDDLLAAALKSARLHVETVAPGSTGLAFGLRARFDRTCSMVFVDETLTPSQATFAKAHELGHFHLHEDPVHEDRAEEVESGWAASVRRLLEPRGEGVAGRRLRG